MIDLLHLGLPEASEEGYTQARSGQRGGGGEQPVLLCVEGAVHDSGTDVVRSGRAQRRALAQQNRIPCAGRLQENLLGTEGWLAEG